jgi:hypothetical protein
MCAETLFANRPSMTWHMTWHIPAAVRGLRVYETFTNEYVGRVGMSDEGDMKLSGREIVDCR